VRIQPSRRTPGALEHSAADLDERIQQLKARGSRRFILGDGVEDESCREGKVLDEDAASCPDAHQRREALEERRRAGPCPLRRGRREMPSGVRTPRRTGEAAHAGVANWRASVRR